MPYLHSPAIALDDVNSVWVLTVPVNPAEFDVVGLDDAFAFDGIQNDVGLSEVSFDSSSVAVVPEPSMLMLFGLGAFIARRKR